jgi:hypothetical protein
MGVLRGLWTDLLAFKLAVTNWIASPAVTVSGVSTAAKQDALSTLFGAQADAAATAFDTTASSMFALFKAIAARTINGRQVPLTFARPADNIPYTGGDVIGDATTAVHELANAGPAGALLMLDNVFSQWELAAVPSGATTFTDHFYDAAPDAITDNSVWVLTSANDKAHHLGSITYNAYGVVGGHLESQNPQLGQSFKLAAGSTSLWVERVTNGGFTPAGATSRTYRYNFIPL